MQISAYELARKKAAAREFDFPHSGVQFRYRFPSELQFMQHIGSIPEDQIRSLARQAAVFVPASMIGWSGIRECDIDADQGSDPLSFSQELIDAVLNRYKDSIIPAFVEIMRRYQEAQRKTEAEVKN